MGVRPFKGARQPPPGRRRLFHRTPRRQGYCSPPGPPDARGHAGEAIGDRTSRPGSTLLPAVLVTGASGFLGGHLGASSAPRLRRARPGPPDQRHAQARGAGDRLCRGDLGDRPSLAAAMRGVRTVFNSAAKVSDWGPREASSPSTATGPPTWWPPARSRGRARGALQLAHRLACRAPVRSSPRTRPTRRAAGKYTQSKLEGERAVLEAHGKRGLSAVVVRPGAVGARRPHILPRIVALLRRAHGLRRRAGATTWRSHVENLSLGLALAAEVPRPRGGSTT
jgi:nucleoside-diphosphate-sugar epimerase